MNKFSSKYHYINPPTITYTLVAIVVKNSWLILTIYMLMVVI